MNAAQIDHAFTANRVSRSRACTAIGIILPILRMLRDQTSGWKFWVKLGIGIAISALEGYAAEFCDS